MENKKVAFRSDGINETGKLIIEYLEKLGGINNEFLQGNGQHSFYFISNGHICSSLILPDGYELLKF